MSYFCLKWSEVTGAGLKRPVGEQKELSVRSPDSLSDRLGYRTIAGRVSNRRGSATSSCLKSPGSCEISVLFAVLVCLPEIASPLLEYFLSSSSRNSDCDFFF